MSTRILVVDDDERVRRSLSTLLDKSGYEVQSVDGAEAAFRRLSTETFDLIFMDLNMPGINGLDGIRSIKLLKEEQKVAVLTAYSSDRIREEAREAGADACLFKPIKLDQITSIIEELAPAPADEEEDAGGD
jgi:two-component system sensor histidine kinase EvgS